MKHFFLKSGRQQIVPMSLRVLSKLFKALTNSSIFLTFSSNLFSTVNFSVTALISFFTKSFLSEGRKFYF